MLIDIKHNITMVRFKKKIKSFQRVKTKKRNGRKEEVCNLFSHIHIIIKFNVYFVLFVDVLANLIKI